MSTEEKPAEEAPVRLLPCTIKLKYPVEFGKTTITELELRRGCAGDMRGISCSDEVPAADLMLIASRLAAQPQKVIELLDVDDAGEVMSIALDFYGRFLGAGKTR